MHCAWPGDYHSLGLTRIQFHSPKVTPLTNPANVMDQGLCYCNSNALEWHNSHQSRVICITDQRRVAFGSFVSRTTEMIGLHIVNNNKRKKLTNLDKTGNCGQLFESIYEENFCSRLLILSRGLFQCICTGTAGLFGRATLVRPSKCTTWRQS